MAGTTGGLGTAVTGNIPGDFWPACQVSYVALSSGEETEGSADVAGDVVRGESVGDVDDGGLVVVVDGGAVDAPDEVAWHAVNASATQRTRMSIRRIDSPPLQRRSPSESCNREEPKGIWGRRRRSASTRQVWLVATPGKSCRRQDGSGDFCPGQGGHRSAATASTSHATGFIGDRLSGLSTVPLPSLSSNG